MVILNQDQQAYNLILTIIDKDEINYGELEQMFLDIWNNSNIYASHGIISMKAEDQKLLFRIYLKEKEIHCEYNLIYRKIRFDYRLISNTWSGFEQFMRKMFYKHTDYGDFYIAATTLK
jgi:phage pi2 protein 07